MANCLGSVLRPPKRAKNEPTWSKISPGRVRTDLKTMWGASVTASGHSGDAPARCQDVPGPSQDAPGTLWGGFGTLPGRSGILFGAAQIAPGTLSDEVSAQRPC